MKKLLSSLLLLSALSADECTKPCETLYFTNDETVAVTPAAGPRTCSDWNFFLTADFTYWSIRQDGMFHAVSGVPEKAIAGSSIGKGTVYDLNWEMNPGFKAGIGLNLPHDGWDVFAEYTWAKTNVSQTATDNRTGDSNNLISYWSINGSALDHLARSHATLDLKFHDVHLELGRNSYLSQYLKARIHAGLQGSWIYQDYNVSQTLVDNSGAKLSQDQDFWGIGLRTGLDNNFQFNQNWSIFADFTLAILWGQFDLSRKDTSTTTAGVTTTNIHTGIKAKTFEPVLSIKAGLAWDEWFSNGDYHASLSAGWEQQLWILQNEFIKVPTETDHIGDLVLQGLTVRARFDF